MQRTYKSKSERRFNGILNRIHGAKTKRGCTFDEQLEQDLAHKINEIQSIGFLFEPDHYLMPKLDELEEIISRVDPTNPEKKNKRRHHNSRYQ